MKLYNKRIVITGGTSGIGLELVKKLASDNSVIVISKKGSLPRSLEQEKYPVELYHSDLAVKAEIEFVVGKIQKRHGTIDVLINNAAVQYTPEFISDDFSFDTIQTEIDINFTAVCHLTYLFLPMLLTATKGEVVNVNTGLAIAPKKGSAIYCATKSALDSFSKSLSYQLEDTTVDVRQCFLPLVSTPMTEGRGMGKLQADDVAEQIVSGIERGRGDIDVGKVSLLRLINYLMPPLAKRIMKRG